MRGTVFYKMSGSGNDFVVLDARTTALADWPSERVVTICDRRNGVGADGLVFLGPEAKGDGLQMVYLNNDGGRVALCGNAALCCTRLAHSLELIQEAQLRLHTDAGVLLTEYRGGNSAAIRFPGFQAPVESRIALEAGEDKIFIGAVGVPHMIVVVQNAQAVDLEGRGRVLRHHPDVEPEGTNVNFVSPGHEPSDPWTIRTFERGIEGETLACGTGTMAAAAAVAHAGLGSLPLSFITGHGVPLEVEAGLQGGQVIDPWLAGEGRLVYTGALE